MHPYVRIWVPETDNIVVEKRLNVTNTQEKGVKGMVRLLSESQKINK